MKKVTPTNIFKSHDIGVSDADLCLFEANLF